MKNKQVILFFILNFLVFCFVTNAQQGNEIPDEFISYIASKSSPCEYKTVYPQSLEELLAGTYKQCSDSITQTEALEDIEQLKYLLETAYSGKEYWQKQGCDFNQIYSQVKEFVESKDVLSVLDFERKISSLFEEKILDAHFSLRGHEYHTFSKRKLIYFADILLEKNKKGDYIVIDSKLPTVNKGQVFDDKDKEQYVFKTLSSKNKENYLVGVWSYKKENEVSLSFNGKTQKIPLHESRLNNYSNKKEDAFYVDTIGNIPVVNVASFDMKKENIPYLTVFENYGKNLQNENAFILNLYNNTGGSSLYSKNFITNLNTNVTTNGVEAYLCSPSISQLFNGLNFDAFPTIMEQPGMREFMQEVNIHKELYKKYKVKPCREWVFDTITNTNQSVGTYNGKMIVLMNREVSSSTETAIMFCKSVRNSIFVGENTYGVGTFSNVIKFYLPNSNICVHISYKISLMPEFRESIGFIPDYWLDTDHPVKEIVNWLNNTDTYQFTIK